MAEISTTSPARTKRPRGEQSRGKILAAARELVADRGYDGTSMAEVSRRCGLPTSSIYWHFSDKDDLMAQVIHDSFLTWTAIWEVPEELDVVTEMPRLFAEVLDALRDSPEFLRLGLQLALQQRTDDPVARRMYLEHRADAKAKLNSIAGIHFPFIEPRTRADVVLQIISSIDGLFVARELDPEVDLERQIALQLRALMLLINDLLNESVGVSTASTDLVTTNAEGLKLTSPTQEQIEALAEQLRTARDNANDVQPPTESFPDLTVEQAYQVQSVNRGKDLESGHRIVGHKIGLTSQAMQKQLGVDQPDYGYLTDRMIIADGGKTSRSSFVLPRVEPEIAFRLAKDLDATKGPVSAADVMAATDAVAVALEIVDSRVVDWRITLPDTIADNASSAAVVFGPWIPLASTGNLADLHADLLLNGEVVDSGEGAAVMGNPAEAVAWLVNAYGALGQSVHAGEFVMSGAMCAAAWVNADEKATARISGLGEVSVTFTGEQDAENAALPDDVRPVVAAVAAVAAGLKGKEISHAEVVVVRPGGIPGASAAEEQAIAAADIDAEIAAMTSALESVGAKQAKSITLINPAVPPVSPGATVTCLVDSQVSDSELEAVAASVRSAVGARLAADVTVNPVGQQSATCPVGPNAVAVSLTLNLSEKVDDNG